MRYAIVSTSCLLILACHVEDADGHHLPGDTTGDGSDQIVEDAPTDTAEVPDLTPDLGPESDEPELPAEPNPDAQADFEARCAAPGVLVCRGFDDESELAPTCCEDRTGAEADANGSMDHISIDPQVRTSGSGALRFEILGRTDANHSGAFRQLMGQAFGPGTSFYVQYRLRLSPEFLSLPGQPKIAIMHHHSATCNDVEWTHFMQSWYGDITATYTACGSRSPGGPADGSQVFQQGDYYCPYGADYASDPNCLKFTPNTWMTFLFHATVGEWGTPTTHLEAWYAVDGGAYQKWVDDPTYTFDAEGDSVEGFDSVYLTTYITGKDPSEDHATAYAWYDELIVSTEPIAAPQF